MKCIVAENCSVPKTECWVCEDYNLYRPNDKKILSPAQERKRLERHTQRKAKKNSPASKRARNNRLKGKAGERELAKLLDIEGLPIKRVAMSGALKASGGKLIGGEDNYAGDMILEVNNEKYLIEVKVGKQIPKFIGDHQADGIEGYCRLFTFSKFVAFLHFGLENLFEPNFKPDKGTKKLHDFFDQDGSSIVAMSPHGTTSWFFAVKNEYLEKIGGSC